MVDSQKPPIIEVPHLLSRARQTRESLITALMWTFYAYLWTPLISLLAWWTGLDLAYETMVVNGGWEELVVAMRWYGMGIAIIFLTIAAWSYSNRWRFRDHERRQFIAPVTDKQLMSKFLVSPEKLWLMRNAGVLFVELDEEANITAVNASSLPEATNSGMPAPLARTSDGSRTGQA